MKKIIILLALIFLITGCSNTITYEFNDESIASNIILNFNLEEFKSFYSESGGHIASEVTTKEEYDDIIYDRYNSTGVIALLKDNVVTYYDSVNYKSDDNNYTFEYSYDYTYENFQDNYYINDCFEFYSYTEDDDYYHYKISGNYTCELKSLELRVKSKNKNISSNAQKIEENTHIWNIEETDNEISFSISKVDISETTSYSKVRIIGMILLIILVLLSFVFYKMVRRNNEF